MREFLVFALTALLAISICPLHAQQYHVDIIHGNNANDGLTPQTPLTSVQNAIDLSIDGDTILIWPGKYTENLFIDNKAIFIKSADHPAVIQPPAGTALSIYGDANVSNLVITKSDIAIECLSGTPTLTNLTIVDNDLSIAYAPPATPNITNCIFANNNKPTHLELLTRYSCIEYDQGQNQLDRWISNGFVNKDDYVGKGRLHYTYNCRQIEIAATYTTTLQQVAFLINNDPKKPGVSAYLVYIEGMYHLLMAADSPGDDYKISINDATSEEWRTDHALLATYDEHATENTIISELYGFSGAMAGHAGIRVLGLKHDGTIVDSTINIDTATTIAELLEEIEIAFDNSIQTCIRNGQITAMDKMPGPSMFEIYTFEYIPSPAGEMFILSNFSEYETGMDIYYTIASLQPDTFKQFRSGQGNINKDPAFVDPAKKDYHLKSQRGRYWPKHDLWVLDGITSPCIDTGDLNVNPANEPKPDGGRVNMGAYGQTAYASMNDWSIAGDINRDGGVDISDFLIVSNNWLRTGLWPKLGNRNVQDAINLMAAMKTVLLDIHTNLIRMKELAEASKTGSYSWQQRIIMDAEFHALANNIDYIVQNNEYNGLTMLNSADESIIVYAESGTETFQKIDATFSGLVNCSNTCYSVDTVHQAGRAFRAMSEAIDTLTAHIETFDQYTDRLVNMLN